MSSGCSRGWQVVTLQNVLILRLALMELVVFSSDPGHLENISKHLSSCSQDGQIHGNTETHSNAME